MPFLSIIVPVYNCAPYLEECVESILAQKFTDFECILVDDGSTDESGAICDAYQAKEKRIKVLHKQNGGLVSARKAGIEASHGTYIGYVDSDDFIHPDMYFNMCDKAQKDKADIVICNIFSYQKGKKEQISAMTMQEGLYEKECLRNDFQTHMLYCGNYFEFGVHPSLCNKIIKRSILYPYQMQVKDEITIGEDAVCSYFCMMQAKKIWVLKDAYYYYRLNENSITQKKDRKKAEKTLIELEYFYEQIKALLNKEDQEILLRQFAYYTAYMLTNLVYNHLRLNEYKTEKKEIYEEYSKMCLAKSTQALLEQRKDMDLPYYIRAYIEHMQKRNTLSYAYAHIARICAGLIRRLQGVFHK